MSWAMTRSICGNKCLSFLKVLNDVEDSRMALMASRVSKGQEL